MGKGNDREKERERSRRIEIERERERWCRQKMKVKKILEKNHEEYKNDRQRMAEIEWEGETDSSNIVLFRTKACIL